VSECHAPFPQHPLTLRRALGDSNILIRGAMYLNDERRSRRTGSPVHSYCPLQSSADVCARPRSFVVEIRIGRKHALDEREGEGRDECREAQRLSERDSVWWRGDLEEEEEESKQSEAGATVEEGKLVVLVGWGRSLAEDEIHSSVVRCIGRIGVGTETTATKHEEREENALFFRFGRSFGRLNALSSTRRSRRRQIIREAYFTSDHARKKRCNLDPLLFFLPSHPPTAQSESCEPK
jgi:hypothetical protein